jgi:hypothetical protein
MQLDLWEYIVKVLFLTVGSKQWLVGGFWVFYAMTFVLALLGPWVAYTVPELKSKILSH